MTVPDAHLMSLSKSKDLRSTEAAWAVSHEQARAVKMFLRIAVRFPRILRVVAAVCKP